MGFRGLGFRGLGFGGLGFRQQVKKVNNVKHLRGCGATKIGSWGIMDGVYKTYLTSSVSSGLGTQKSWP